MPHTFRLRNNQTTRDRRLDRLVSFDERSRQYPIRSILREKPRRGRNWLCATHLDQGSEGACVGYGISHELAAQPQVCTGITDQFARQKIYWQAQMEDEWTGGSYPGAAPHYEGTSVLAGVKVAQKLGFFESYRWAFGLNDVLDGIAQEGPCVLGLNWLKGMFEPDGTNTIHAKGEVMGGHCILARGISVVYKRVKLHNSWGPDWGEDGWCWISWDDLGRLLTDGGEAVFFQGRKELDASKL